MAAGAELRFGYGKAHVCVTGNDRAVEIAKVGCLMGGPLHGIERGVRALRKRMRAVERFVITFGAGRVSR